MEVNRDENRDLHKFLTIALSAMLDFIFSAVHEDQGSYKLLMIFRCSWRPRLLQIDHMIFRAYLR